LHKLRSALLGQLMMPLAPALPVRKHWMMLHELRVMPPQL
jgi:hypothetical protein